MASISNRLLHLRRDMYSYTHRPHSYPLRHFSSPSDSSDTPQPDSGQSRPASFSDYFKEVKATLQKEPPRPQQPPNKPFSLSKRTPSQSPPHKAASLEEIRRNLSEFRSRSAPPPPKPLRSAETSPSAPYVSLQELYSKRVSAKGGGSDASSDAKSFPGAGAPHSLSAIRETLNRLKSSAPAATRRTDPAGKISDRVLPLFKLPDGIGGDIPAPFYGKERTGGWGAAYGYKDIGEKLKSLRPEKRTGQWFSFQELNDRLAQLREIENQESEKGIGVAIKDIREGLKKINKAKEEKPRLGISILENVGTPSFMLSPPKEHLVEKFFHPDNMSSAEKLKLELKKVQEEFKMSESDCGSARVQVAQLTTKIKHLSSVLAKKDKHSRRGLLAMVQRRKKLLKYLRRTDWDSYELVLSKLGLRDNPDLKA